MILHQLMIGSAVIVLTVLLQAFMFAFATRLIDRIYSAVLLRYHTFGLTAVIVAGVLWVLLSITADVWIWAYVLMLIDALYSLEEAVYFSLVSFTTLGFGDIVLERDWRVLSGLIGANGLLIFGWSIAFMSELVRKLRGAP